MNIKSIIWWLSPGLISISKYSNVKVPVGTKYIQKMDKCILFTACRSGVKVVSLSIYNMCRYNICPPKHFKYFPFWSPRYHQDNVMCLKNHFTSVSFQRSLYYSQNCWGKKTCVWMVYLHWNIANCFSAADLIWACYPWHESKSLFCNMVLVAHYFTTVKGC